MAESATKLEDLVGEGKKFKTTEDLAKAKVEADTFIERLQQETATLRDELAKAMTKATANDTLERLMTELANKNNDPGKTIPETKPSDQGNQPQALTQEDIVKLMEAREAAKAEARNLAVAMEQVRKVWGDKLEESLNAKAEELGLDRAQVDAVAKRSPSAFINLLGLNQQTDSTRPMARGGQTVTPETPKFKDGVRNRAFYENKKNEMGVTKFIMDRNLQIQLHKDMARLGDAWDS